MLIMRIWAHERSSDSLRDIQEHWSALDLYQASATLDFYDAAEAAAHEKARSKLPKTPKTPRKP